MFGNWTIDINTNGMPQKVATAFSTLAETHLGAEYDFIAYLGEQQVNGVNHAVLAKQVLVNGRDTENIVLIIFNERPGDTEATLVSIERVVESGSGFGGTSIGVQFKDELTNAIMEIWNKAFEGFVGGNFEPVALLATQVVNGVDYIFLAKCTPITLNPKASLLLVTINDVAGTMTTTDLLANKREMPLGYSFTWLRR